MKIKIIWLTGAFLLSLGMIFVGCEAPDQPVYDASNPDPHPTGKDPAIISNINPTSGFFGEEITINGDGFDLEPSNNMVRFGQKIGTVISATETELTVLTPGVIGDTAAVAVAITGSEYWSNSMPFTFNNLPEEYNLEMIDEEITYPNGVAVDADENVYIGGRADEVIYKVTPSGEKSEFASVPVIGHIHFGPDDYLYVCEMWEGKIVRISPDGNTIEDVIEVESPVDFDWDENGNMFIASNDAGVYVLDSSGSLGELIEIGTTKNVRVFGNQLYISRIWEGVIEAYEITGTSLDVDNPQTIYEGDSPASFDIAGNGFILLAEAWDTSLYPLFQDGSLGDPLYEGEMMTPMRYMVWRNKSIYVVYPGWTDVGGIMKAYIGLEQAPRYGQQ